MFKVADRTATAAFYRETLGMKVSGSVNGKQYKYRSQIHMNPTRYSAMKNLKKAVKLLAMGKYNYSLLLVVLHT